MHFRDQGSNVVLLVVSGDNDGERNFVIVSQVRMLPKSMTDPGAA